MSISDLEKCRRHALTEVFWEISSDRSRKGSDREVTRSHVRHRVSLVNVPSVWGNPKNGLSAKCHELTVARGGKGWVCEVSGM